MIHKMVIAAMIFNLRMAVPMHGVAVPVVVAAPVIDGAGRVIQ